MYLKNLRTQAGVTAPEMARRMGVSTSQVHRIEYQYPDVMFPSLRRYMDALDVKIRFVGDGLDLESDDVEQDPSGERVRAGRKADRTRRSMAAH